MHVLTSAAAAAAARPLCVCLWQPAALSGAGWQDIRGWPGQQPVHLPGCGAACLTCASLLPADRWWLPTAWQGALLQQIHATCSFPACFARLQHIVHIRSCSSCSRCHTGTITQVCRPGANWLCCLQRVRSMLWRCPACLHPSLDCLGVPCACCFLSAGRAGAGRPHRQDQGCDRQHGKPVCFKHIASTVRLAGHVVAGL